MREQKKGKWRGGGKKLLEKLRGLFQKENMRAVRIPRILKNPRIDLLLVCGFVIIFGYLAVAVLMRTPQPFAGVASGSMEPYLSRGDLIIIKNVRPGDTQEGDVIAHTARERSGSYTRVHRVVRVEKDPAAGLVFWTKGDALDSMDPAGTIAEDVKGKVARKAPHLGYLWLFFWGKYGLALIVVALALYLLIFRGGEILGYAKKIRLQKPDPEVLARLEKIEEQEKTTAEALSQFTAAIGEYAKHLGSHTAIVQGIQDAVQELSKVTRELRETVEQKTVE